MSADVGPPSSIVAAWMTQRHGIAPPDVSTAAPSAIGARARDSSSIAGPPARAIAAATPPPCRSRVLAALAIASTSRVVTSASSTSIAAIGLRYPHDRAQAGARPRAGAGRLLPRLGAPCGGGVRRRGLGREPAGRDRRGRVRGRAEAVDRLVELCRRGTGACAVSQLDVVDEPPEGLDGFAWAEPLRRARGACRLDRRSDDGRPRRAADPAERSVGRPPYRRTYGSRHATPHPPRRRDRRRRRRRRARRARPVRRRARARAQRGAAPTRPRCSSTRSRSARG